jgi:hypothetical protein
MYMFTYECRNQFFRERQCKKKENNLFLGTTMQEEKEQIFPGTRV